MLGELASLSRGADAGVL